jgi:hypothetical protein
LRVDRDGASRASSWPTMVRSEQQSSPCQPSSDHRAWPAYSSRH